RGTSFAQSTDMKHPFLRLIPYAIAAVCVLCVGRVSAAQENRTTAASINDAWITTQIFAKYFADPDIKPRHIDVSPAHAGGTVTGPVYSEEERRQGRPSARDSDGVVRATDKRVVPPGKPPLAADARDRARAEGPKVQADGRRAVDRLGNDISDAWITT